MPHRKLVTALCGYMSLCLCAAVSVANEATLRALGAAGDGKTDDRAAIEEALLKANGSPIDGEGATYAVRGNVEVHVDVNLRNATLVQITAPADVSQYIPSAQGTATPVVEPADALVSMIGTLPMLGPHGIASYAEDPNLTTDEVSELMRMIDVRTLAIAGTSERPISVRLQKIKVVRGDHPGTGGGEAAAIRVDQASSVIMKDVEVTGDGKGAGIWITNSSKLRLERLHVHDMNWSPYIGDAIFESVPIKSIKEDFSWNTFPIYRLDSARSRFVRVRIQEQLAGIQIFFCDDVELLDSRVERLQTRIGERLYPLQADGMTVTNVTNFTVRNCHFSEVWEGVDFNGNSDDGFVCENCTASDAFAFGFKLAHPKRNGRLINCTALRSGGAGFVMEPELENIEFIGCQARETGASGFWTKENGQRLMTIAGFRLGVHPSLPRPLRIMLRGCKAINAEHPGCMDFGIVCEPGIDPVDRKITATDCTVEGAKHAAIKGFASN
jgi:hypothetical protein